MTAQSITAASKFVKGFVVAVCVVIVLLEAWGSMQDREIQLLESGRSTANMALALSQHANQTFDEVDIVLRTAREHFRKDGNTPEGLERTHQFLVENVSSVPQLAGLYIYDETGRSIATSLPLSDTTITNQERDYFVYHQQHRSGIPHIGSPIRSKATGQWLLTISRRIDKMDGSFGGVLLGTIDIGFLERFYAKFNIGKMGVILFGLSDGTILYRRPLLDDSIGKSLANSHFYQQYVTKTAANTVEIRSIQDNVVRISSFQHVENYPLFVTVALSKQEMLERWTRRTWLRGIGIALLLLILSYVGVKMVKQVSLREAAQAEATEAKQQLEKMYQTLEEQSQRDGLTGVFNRRYFDQAISTELSRFHRLGGSLILIMIDVDHFKKYNDTYGHAAGDTCLQKVASAIESVTQRPSDIVARYGGEEFVAILPTAGQDGGIAVANQMLTAVRNLDLAHSKSPVGKVRISVGIASLIGNPGHLVSPRELIETADGALYTAKEQGRDQAVYRDFHFNET
ncbi:sensor domain-containing diguanylate cyclase [Herbaspirillum camelliae]|uniref:sensor domain-containing diguanylate cyclase n=1 Tax=Herbaspirillum camelliae TaxID=1892903 RepID=UPI00094A0AFF|nr:sensor domain-containing diguanylate cyclase [Herbaspirillum camelliae]